MQDQRGGEASAQIAIGVSNPGGLAQQISTAGSTVTVHFAGIPGFAYEVERADDAAFSVNLTVLATTNAPALGVFTVTDPNPPTPTACYRLKYKP